MNVQMTSAQEDNNVDDKGLGGVTPCLPDIPAAPHVLQGGTPSHLMRNKSAVKAAARGCQMPRCE